jgi:hypothetical protein
MGDVAAQEYPNAVLEAHFPVRAGTGETIVSGAVLPLMAVSKDTWLDDAKLTLETDPGNVAVTGTLYMAPAGTALSAGTALGTFTALNAAPWTTLYTPRSLTPTTAGKWSGIRILAGYHVGIVTGGATLPAGFAATVTLRYRNKPQ